MKRMYVMVGVPGSGKSTFIKNHINGIKTSYAVISRDEIRFSLVAEDEPYFSKETAVFNKFISDIKESLKENDVTIVDATHINGGSRGKLFRALGSTLKDVQVVALVIKVPMELAIERNNMREGRSLVPESAIENMYSQFSLPTFNERFDRIIVCEYDNKGREIKIREEIR